MYSKDDKRQLYWLIDQYLSGKIDESTFCDEFYYCYDLGIDYNMLSEPELQIFDELNSISSRFSKYEEDHKLSPKAYASVEELKKKIIETKEKLKNNS